ncbi:MAG: GTPase HflX [Candidatus Bathyarchaeum sp.]|nr:MAG: GTPase HflX [Candidatus Bathyarchaeum sp.]
MGRPYPIQDEEKGGREVTKTIVVQRRLATEPSNLEELKNLAKAAGYTTVGSIEQVRKRDPKYQIGRGKINDLSNLVNETGAEKIIFDNSLTPVQAYNLAKVTGLTVIDRFQLILEIFSIRASTYEAELQIQLASLRYELSKAKERVKLARMEEQPGFMGLGKYEVDVYFETVKRQISSTKEKLKKKQQERELHRVRRTELGFSSISLAGYTNAGKSSLFNLLAEEAVPVDNALFTTLSTTTRAVQFSKRKVLLTDTVGFIDRLPLKLVKAFHSTLEETIFSDLIILVVDMSEPEKEIERKLSCSLDTIQQIGATTIPVVTALNKIDLIEQDELQQKMERLKDAAPNLVPISVMQQTNIASLRQEITRYLEGFVEASFSVKISDESMALVSQLFERAHVLNIEYEDKIVKAVFKAIPWFADRVKGRVEKLGGEFKPESKSEG